LAESFDRVGLVAGLEAAGISWRELDPDGRQRFAIDGVEPAAICWPSSTAEASACLKVADRVGAAISPRGAGTKTALGNRPRGCDLIVSTERLNHVVEYAPANLTVTVEAGLSLAALQSALAVGGQTLPIDPPDAGRATVGGILAANASGPRRLGFGAGRDLVIGTLSVTPAGAIVRSGGRVVKNVAGYDLAKLYVGSLGTLVLLTEVNLKVTPLPAAKTTVFGWFPSLEQVEMATRAVSRSPTMPAALEILNPPAVAALALAVLPRIYAGYLLLALGSAPGDGVGRQAAEFTRLFHEAGAQTTERLIDGNDTELWARLAAQGDFDGSASRMRLKVAVPPGQLLDALLILEAHAGELGGNPSIFGRAASGVFYATWLPSAVALNGHLADTVAGIEAIRQQISRLGGSLVVERCPIRLKEQIDVWGDVGNAIGVMRRLKAALDPRGIMNPGRFVGGI
jgi:glycolate oxidase FAD binding subunit